jgi:hypothetical protein
MFMKPDEILDTRDPRDEVEVMDELGRTHITSDPEAVWEQKLSEAEASGLADDIAENGVEKPVELSRDYVLDGHHRTIASAVYAPEKWVPVTHHEFDYDKRGIGTEWAT